MASFHSHKIGFFYPIDVRCVVFDACSGRCKNSISFLIVDNQTGQEGKVCDKAAYETSRSFHAAILIFKPPRTRRLQQSPANQRSDL